MPLLIYSTLRGRMRKAYKKARWLKSFSRVEKRGGKVFVLYKTIKTIQVPSKNPEPLTFDRLLNSIERLGIDVTDWRR